MLFATHSLRKRKFKPLVERLEARNLLSSTPLGAFEADTGEYLLGKVAVTPVFLQSDGSVDTSTQSWDLPEIQANLLKVNDSLQWWIDTLDNLTLPHRENDDACGIQLRSCRGELEFVVDDSYAIAVENGTTSPNPHPSPYEPIDRSSDDYSLWVDRFLFDIGYGGGESLATKMLRFNHDQRLSHDADWAFTIFIADSSDDPDRQFNGGAFTTAFAFAGGLFYITPSTRPTSTYAHELGHIFYALDEYPGGASYTVERGYYSTQNINAANNPNASQQPSIMSGGQVLQDAFRTNVSPASTLALVGWQDSDNDGIFDVLDVPLELTGSGRFDESEGVYRFNGSASAKALPNLNPAGLQNDITLNEISRIEYRVDGEEWNVASEPNVQQTTLELSIPIDRAFSSIEIRAIDQLTGITSNIVSGNADTPAGHSTTGVGGHVWLDRNEDGQLDNSEPGISGIQLSLLDQSGSPVETQTILDPDQHTSVIPSNLNGITVSGAGSLLNGNVGAFRSDFASTGTKAFFGFDTLNGRWTESWSSSLDRSFRADFDAATSYVSIDATGLSDNSYARLEAYSATGDLLARSTSQSLAVGQSATLEVSTPNSDIAFIRAFGHAGTSASLDNLVVGPTSTVFTDAFGVFSIPGIQDGAYQLQANGPANAFAFTDNPVEIQIVNGQVAEQVGIRALSEASPWQNPIQKFDVDNNGAIEPLDALRIINDLNRNGSRLLNTSDLTPPYFDVDGNGSISPVDALAVINALNRLGGLGEQAIRQDKSDVEMVSPQTGHSVETLEPAEFELNSAIETIDHVLSLYALPEQSKDLSEDDKSEELRLFADSDDVFAIKSA